MILGAAAALVLGSLVVLAAFAQADADIEIDERSLAQAKTAHRRAQARAEARARRSERRTAQPSRPRPAVRLPEPDPEPEPPAIEPDRHRPRIQIQRTVSTDDPETRKKVVEARMDGANYLYDRKRYEQAMAEAIKVLGDLEKPQNRVRMLRVVVSSACIMGKSDVAEEHAESLPDGDFQQMKLRCKRYGTDLER